MQRVKNWAYHDYILYLLLCYSLLVFASWVNDLQVIENKILKNLENHMYIKFYIIPNATFRMALAKYR